MKTSALLSGELAKLVCLTFFGLVVSGPAQPVSFSVLTMTNPVPAAGASFGGALAPLGNDRLIVSAVGGASGTGEACLMDRDGALLATFVNPNPVILSLFGQSVAAVGTEYVVIGTPRDSSVATRSGAAYVFDTNGNWVNTLVRPVVASQSQLGNAVAAVGEDRVLVGAYTDNIGGPSGTGAAYLFDMSGTALTTFTNPTPGNGSDQFGYSVAALDTDRVIIGAPYDSTSIVRTNVGSAYLYSVDGTLLTTISNPAPVALDHFGNAVAGLGADRIIVGAYDKDTGASSAGVVYLFNTNGTLLKTFVNPTPANNDLFGVSVAGVGSHYLLIGAYLDDTGTTDAGAAYLFDTNANLITTFTNPAPTTNDLFGFALAARGSRIFIGAYNDDAGTTNSGVAYAYTFNLPVPQIAGLGTNYTVSWSGPEEGLILQQADALSYATDWTNTPGIPAVSGPTNIFSLTVPLSQPRRFFHLLRP